MDVNKRNRNDLGNKSDIKDGAYFKWNSKTGYAAQYQFRPLNSEPRRVGLQLDCLKFTNSALFWTKRSVLVER